MCMFILAFWTASLCNYSRGHQLLKCFQRSFPLNSHHIVLIRPPLVASTSECTPPSDYQAVLQTNLDTEINPKDEDDNKNRTPLFLVLKCFATRPNTELSVLVRNSCTRPTSIAPHPVLMHNQVVLPASGVLTPLRHVLKLTGLVKLAKTSIPPLKSIAIVVGTDLADAVANLDRTAINPDEK